MPATNEPPTASLAAACDAVFTLDAPAVVGLIESHDTWTFRDGPRYQIPEDLIGFVAPPEWDGMAVVSTGTARHLDNGGSLRARVTYALDRTGRGASSITTVEGTTRIDNRPGQAATGHLADVCHRALGLAAAPEASSPTYLLAASWVSDVLSACDHLGDGFDVDDWDGVASLCPFEAGAIDHPGWDEVHATIVDAGEGWAGLCAGDVAWMDPPTLARFMLATMPPLRRLLDQARSVLAPPVMGQLVAAITAAGVPITIGTLA